MSLLNFFRKNEAVKPISFDVSSFESDAQYRHYVPTLISESNTSIIIKGNKTTVIYFGIPIIVFDKRRITIRLTGKGLDLDIKKLNDISREFNLKFVVSKKDGIPIIKFKGRKTFILVSATLKR